MSSLARGPCGLFAVFELGLLDIKCHVVDILDRPGGQCAELYPGKADLRHSGLPDRHRAGPDRQPDAADRAVRAASSISRDAHRQHLGTRLGGRPLPADDRCRRNLPAKAVVIAAGGGSFQPKRPPVEGIEAYEGKSVFYAVRKMEDFRDQDIVIVGGGDSALDWTLNLQPIAAR
jgi:thioredoxin reductase (NADPH)